MERRIGLISYDGLPISSGGAHGLGRMRPKEAWLSTNRFVERCTTSVSPRDISLQISTEDEPEPGFADRLRESATASLGLRSEPDRRIFDGRHRSGLVWDIPIAQASAVAEWRHSLGNLPTSGYRESVRVTFDFDFRFVDCEDGTELPFQGSESYLGQPYNGYGLKLGESGCRLSMTNRSSLCVIFFIPIEEPCSELWRYVAFLQSHLPFKFSRKHWKHWKLMKKRDYYMGNKIKDPQLPEPC